MGINTGLGWECDPRYLIYNADTDLGHAASRHFRKLYNGYAFAFFAITSTYKGPVIISTEPDNVYSYYTGTILGPIYDYNFTYLRKRWYVCNMHWMNTTDVSYGVLVPHVVTDENVIAYRIRDFKSIMKQAGVKPYISKRGWAFITGFAVGLVSKAWLYVNEVTMGLISKFVTRNGTYSAIDDGAEGYSSVVVNVPNSYTSVDEGKVVSDGELISQTNLTVTSNGIYNTSNNKQVSVEIPAANGMNF